MRVTGVQEWKSLAEVQWLAILVIAVQGVFATAYEHLGSVKQRIWEIFPTAREGENTLTYHLTLTCPFAGQVAHALCLEDAVSGPYYMYELTPKTTRLPPTIRKRMTNNGLPASVLR